MWNQVMDGVAPAGRSQSAWMNLPVEYGPLIEPGG